MGTVFKNLAPSQQQVQLPCFMMDPSFTKNRDFFGRASVLAELEKCLLPDFKGVPTAADQSNLSVVGMHGMPGVGKTEIAMQFVFTQRDKFDAVFWICADDETKLEADFCRIATELGLQSKNDQPNPTIMKNLVKEWLSRPRRILNGSEELAGPREPSWLIVFDNADNPSLLDGYLDTYGRGSILVTSRNPTVKDLRGVKSIALEPFTEEDASEFLDCLTNKAGGREDASRIANHLGGLPLAIAQMAGIIRNQFLTYSELLESFDDLNEQAELYGTWEGMVNKTARGDISSIWMINQLSPDARRLLEIISLLFPDQISDDLLHRKHPKSGSDDSCLVIPMSRPAFRKARAMLIHGSVIRRNEERKEIWIHRVPRQVVRSSLTADAKVAAFRCALKLVIAAWPKENFEKRHNKATVPEREKILPHVLSLRDFYKNEWLHDFYDVDFDMASILQKSAWLLYERGNLVRALPLAELARDIATKPGREECPELLSSIYDILGCIANGTNRPDKSMEYNTKLLELRERISAMTGVEDFPLAYAHNQKGCAMMMAAKYEEGRERFTDALRIWHAHPDFKPGIASMEYANLGLAHLLLGEPDKASDVLEKGLYEQEQGFGRDNPESFRPGRILHALGNVRVVQGRHEEAEVFHRRALNLYIAAVGPRYHRVADMCHKLAQHCIRHGDEESLRNGMWVTRLSRSAQLPLLVVQV